MPTAEHTLTDLFCGAGGSSTGATQVPGVTVRVASNHWALAVQTHHTNHQAADHICADLSQIDPRYFPRTSLLWASPECTKHSIARGKKSTAAADPLVLGGALPPEAAERSRATMWDVPRFAEIHQYQAVIVENVVDAANWGPFRAWLMAMDSLGYDHHIVYLNSMHAWAAGDPAPQSRDRMYAIFWRKANPVPDLEQMQRPPAWCPEHGEIRAMQAWKNPARRWGRYRAQYVYRCPHTSCRDHAVEPYWLPAASIINWSDTGTRVGDRPRPLADKTMARIRSGITRYWSPDMNSASASSAHAQTARNAAALRGAPGAGAFPPFIAELRGGGSDVRSTAHSLSTVTASGTHHALIMHDGETSTAAQGPSRFTPEDCRLRMLSPKEIKGAMAFPAEYRILGTRREQVRMSGNAVTPPTSRDLIGAVVATL